MNKNKEILIDYCFELMLDIEYRRVKVRNAIIALMSEEIKEARLEEDSLLSITPNQICENQAIDLRVAKVVERYCDTYEIDTNKPICSNKKGETLAYLTIVQAVSRGRSEAREAILEFVN